MKGIVNFGHGPKNTGYDPGAIGPTRYQEATQNKEIGELVVADLRANNWEILAIQDGDLWDVTNYANKNKPDAFLSIHANAFANPSAHGIETIILGRGGMGEKIAKEIQKELVLATGLFDRGVKVSNLHVLRETIGYPAVLTEVGFISNPKEEALMKQDSWDKLVATAICKGFSRAVGMPYSGSLNLTPRPAPAAMYRVILDGKQIMALSSQDAAIAEVKKAVDAGQVQKGVIQRNTDGVIAFEYVKLQTPTPPPANPPEQDSAPAVTPKTLIMGTETITVEQCQQLLTKRNSDAPDIIQYYKKHGEALGIRWGYAVAQMIKETGYLKFGGDVKPAQNNYAGIGAVGGGAVGATFLTPEAGVIAQLQHLFAYASTGDLGDYAQLDPRFSLVKRGSCPNWEDLNGHWAVPGVGYGEDIIQIYKEMASEIVIPVVADPVVTENGAVALLRKVLALLLDFFKG